MSQIELKNICKSYGNRNIIKDFNLSIEKGEFIGIKGNSGAGKTTLLNIIGLLEPCEGEIQFDGDLVSCGNQKQVKQILKDRIGYLFQNFALIDDLTVYENLKIVMKKEHKEALRKKMAEVLEKLELNENMLEQKIYVLSGGEQQRIAIARLMLKECDIILADEPTGSLDVENGRIILELLKKLQKEDKTVIMVSHDERAFVYCTRVIELK